MGNGSAWTANGDGRPLHIPPGVIRRGGGRYNNRSGPYDRRVGGGRYKPTSGNSPNRPQPENVPFIPPGHPAAAAMFGRFPDAGSGGQQGMGPREAVQGRSIKSYEDLDAVGGGGGSELDY